MEVWRADDGTPLTLYAIESREGQPVFHVLWLDDDDRLYTSWWFFDTEPATQDDLLDLMRAAVPVLRDHHN